MKTWKRCIIQLYSDLKFVLIGDFSGRVGNLQTIPEVLLSSSQHIQESRASKDATVNKNGALLLSLLKDFCLIILNGRVVGDKFGVFSLASLASTTIGLSLISVDILSHELKFEVSVPFFKILNYLGSSEESKLYSKE